MAALIPINVNSYDLKSIIEGRGKNIIPCYLNAFFIGTTSRRFVYIQRLPFHRITAAKWDYFIENSVIRLQASTQFHFVG